jgi:hypothetical protein
LNRVWIIDTWAIADGAAARGNTTTPSRRGDNGALGPVQFLSQLLRIEGGKIEALALCFLTVVLYFVEKSLGMLGPALEFLHDSPAFLSSSWFTHLCASSW